MPPSRSLKPELLDQSIIDQQELAANLRDLRTSDILIGATRLVWRTLRPLLGQFANYPNDPPSSSLSRTPCMASLLDVATGGADAPRTLAEMARQAGYQLQPFGSDRLLEVVQLAQGRGVALHLLQHDALHAPFADQSFDFTTCILALHHFTPAEAALLFQELARITRHTAIVVDLRRTWLGYFGAQLLACGPWGSMARHDGPLSVLRAYTPEEVREIARIAGVQAEVQSAGPLLMRVTFKRSSVQTLERETGL